MKKLLLIFAIAFISCSKEETVPASTKTTSLEVCGCLKETFKIIPNVAGGTGAIKIDIDTLCIMNGVETPKTFITDNTYFTIDCPHTWEFAN